MDIGWLLNHPSTLLWADPIFMAQWDFEHVHSYLHTEVEEEAESLRLFFDSMKEVGIIQVVDPGALLTPEAEVFIGTQVEVDEATYGGCGDCEEDHDDGLIDPARIELGGQKYCPVIIQGIYGTLVMSRLLDSTALLDPMRLRFCRDRFGAIAEGPDVGNEVNAINSVYDIFLPDIISMGDYRLFCGVRDDCANSDECAKNSKANTLRLVDDVLRLRDSPELVSLAKYVDAKLPEVGYDDSRLLTAMRVDLRRMQKKVLDTVPRLQSVSRFALYASLPAYLAAVAGKPGLLTIAPPALVAFSRALGSYADKMEEQYRWTAAISETIDYEALAAKLAD